MLLDPLRGLADRLAVVEAFQRGGIVDTVGVGGDDEGQGDGREPAVVSGEGGDAEADHQGQRGEDEDVVPDHHGAVVGGVVGEGEGGGENWGDDDES